MNVLARLLRGRTSQTQSTAALWAKSLLNAGLFFCVFMVALPWLAHRLWPAALPFPSPLRSWAGAFLFVVGLGVWILCLDAFTRWGRGTPLPVDAPRNLVANGPFAVIRNPLIAAELLVVWGEAVAFASAGIVAYASALTVVAHLVVLRFEEPELRERFGEPYEAYCRAVPRWLPRLRGRGAGGAATP